MTHSNRLGLLLAVALAFAVIAAGHRLDIPTADLSPIVVAILATAGAKAARR